MVITPFLDHRFRGKWLDFLFLEKGVIPISIWKPIDLFIPLAEPSIKIYGRSELYRKLDKRKCMIWEVRRPIAPKGSWDPF